MALDAGTVGYLQALGIGLLVALILILIFGFLRPRVPDVYDHRALLNLWKSHEDFNGTRVKVVSPRPENSFFGWLKPVLSMTEDEIIAKLGLDAAMYLRYLKTSFRMFAVLSLVAAAVLMPVYGTGNVKNDVNADEEDQIRGLLVISLANVESGSARLWATTIMEFVVAIVVTFFMWGDFRKYAEFRRQHVLSENPANYALVVFDIPKEQLNEQAVRDRFELMVPGQVSEVILVRRCAAAKKLQAKLDAAVTQRELAEYIKSVKGVNPEFRPGFCGCLMCHKPKVDKIEYWQEEETKLAGEIVELGNTEEFSGSAIVVFSNRRACSLLAQANIATESMSWTVGRIGEPNGIHWPAFNVPAMQAEPRMLFVFAFVMVFTLFWTIPATAIVGLASLQSLAANAAFEWLRPLLDVSPAVTGLIEGLLPPTVMAVLISLIPTLFRFMVGLERIPSLAIVERKTRDYFYVFTIYGTFIAYVIGSSIIDQIDEIINDPTTIIDSLATGTPREGLFFATFIVLQTFIPLSLQLSGIVRVILRAIFLKLSKTERQKRKARSGGSLFQFFRYYGQAMLISFLALMYTSLQPIVTVTAVLYFGYALVVCRYLLGYTMYAPWDGAGESYPGAYWGTMGGLILKQIVTIAIISLKQGTAEAILCIIPLLFTIIVSLSVYRRYRAISDHGSLHDMFEESSKLEEIPARYHGIYDQPAGRVTKYVNLSGVEEAGDVYEEVEFDDADTDALQSEHPDENIGYVPDKAADRVDV
eukprot:GFKZ01009404.1.p1 GENE.GFKZ01009404.1~~GFKZ01009404.1.p1  ORF type:complete len:758 (+),score=103.78 GFKZ01009404.1:307-2580(+)